MKTEGQPDREATPHEEWLSRADGKMAQFTPWILALSAGCAVLLAPFSVPGMLVRPFQTGALVLVILSAALVLAARRSGRPLIRPSLVLQIGASIAISYYNYLTIFSTDIAVERFMATLATIGIASGLTIMSPTNKSGRWILIGFLHFIIAGVSLRPAQHVVLAFGMLTFMLVLSLLVKWGILLYIHREARQETRIRELIRESERRKIEAELTLARKVQDALVPERQMVLSGSLNVASYQIKHSRIDGGGGTWMAAKAFRRGPAIVCVADATGEGIQAALVVHAVQSLWADAMSGPYLEAREWMARVNKMLYCLGEREPHTVNMGLLELHQEKVVYWCAGHPPAYARFADERLAGAKPEPVVHALIAHGTLLGKSPQLMLTPKVLDLPLDRPIDLLLGGGPASSPSTATRKDDVERVFDRLLGRPESPASEAGGPGEDTLIWIHREPVETPAASPAGRQGA